MSGRSEGGILRGLGHLEDLKENMELELDPEGWVGSDGQKAAGLFRFSFLRNRWDVSIFLTNQWFSNVWVSRAKLK